MTKIGPWKETVNTWDMGSLGIRYSQVFLRLMCLQVCAVPSSRQEQNNIPMHRCRVATSAEVGASHNESCPLQDPGWTLSLPPGQWPESCLSSFEWRVKYRSWPRMKYSLCQRNHRNWLISARSHGENRHGSYSLVC